MNKTALIAPFALMAGVSIGLAIQNLLNSDEPVKAPAPTSGVSVKSSETAPLVLDSSRDSSALTVTLNPKPSDQADGNVSSAHTVENLSPAPDATTPARIASLVARLQQEQTARQRLEKKLGELETALATLDKRLVALAERDNANDRPAQAGTGGDGVNTDSLIAAGFSPPEAEVLAQRWGEQQMDLLYLRDQAIREGWMDTPRFREASRELRDGNLSLQDELGDDDYDRFLYATGQPNRVTVTSVFESSPAQASGIRPGDMIVSYDGRPIRSGIDVRDATTSGAPGEPVPVEVLRNGEPIEVTLPRGPLGIRMDMISAEPD